MAQKRVTVGTSPVLIARDNVNRASINISMIPSSIESGNTGVVYLGKGFVPQAVTGSPSSGDPISQGSQITDVPQFDGDPSIFKGQWWAVADTADQEIIIDEQYISQGR